MKRVLSGVAVECIRGDIVAMKGFDAIVNAANAWLRPGGGVTGYVHAAAGSQLLAECISLAPIKPGQAVITTGHKLPCRYIIHSLGPVYSKDEPSAEILTDCYRNIFKLAEEYDVRKIALPVISTGGFGYPFREAVTVILKTLREIIPSLRVVSNITFVIRNQEKYKIFEQELAFFELTS